MSVPITDPRFYNTVTFMRKNHLAEKEINEFRRMTSEQIQIELQKLGMMKAGHLFWLLVQSFDIADRVAKAGWGYAKAMESQDEYNAKAEYEEMTRALHEYSPGNFQRYKGDFVFAFKYFEQMFNELQSVPRTVDAWEELIFRYTEQLQKLVSDEGAPREAPDPGYVRHGMASNLRNGYPLIEINGETHLPSDKIVANTFGPLCDVPMPPGEPKRAWGMPTCSRCVSLGGING